MVKRVLCLALILVAVCAPGVFLEHVMATGDESPAWSRPSVMAMKKVGGVSAMTDEPVFLDNLDCNQITYRLVNSGTVQTGCFSETALGLIDSDDDVVIFNGTDEGLPLISYMPHQVLVPQPQSLQLISLNPVSTGGSLVGIYKNPLGLMRDQRDLLGRLTAKELTAAPDITLRGEGGQPLVINAQTMAFSDDGRWLVAETVSDSFVRIDLETLSVTAFAPAYVSQGGPSSLKSRIAVTEGGRFVAIANDMAGAFKVYDLATCNETASDLFQRCRAFDYWPFVGQHINGLRSVRHVRFINDSLISFRAVSATGANSGIYELAPVAQIKSLTGYIGLGDSYTSGEGAFDYLGGTDTDDNLCHLSQRSYPLLLTRDLFGGSSGHSVACSGAVINDLMSTSGNYRGQARGAASLEQLQESQPRLLESVESNFTPGYVAQHHFVRRWQPGVATVSVGGNDVGFGAILQNCVAPHISHFSDNTCYNSYEDRLELTRLIDRTVPRWTALYKQLQRESPDTQLYAIGYPQVADADGNCAVNVQLNKSELRLAADVIDYLNLAIVQAAAAARIPYIDISHALAGHRLCETTGYNVAVNGLTAGKDSGVLGIGLFGRESYHPNTLGHALIEKAILKQMPGLAGKSPAAVEAKNTAFLDAPKTGRRMYTVIPVIAMTNEVGKLGAQLPIHVSGVQNGLRPSSVYTAHLDGPLGPEIGTITSVADGDILASVAIPGNVIPGGHRIDITGLSQNGESVDITQPTFISAGDEDSDNDGVNDAPDSCPRAINSNQDQDRDKVDDICDGIIGSGQPIIGTGTAREELRFFDPPSGHNNLQLGQLKGSAAGNQTTRAARHQDPSYVSDSPFPSLTNTYARVPREPLYTIRWLPWMIIFSGVYILLFAIDSIPKAAAFDYNDGMIWLRKGLVLLLSFVLLGSLLGTALATSANNTVGKPEKIKTMLAESKLYDHFLDYATDQAKKSAGDNADGSVSLSDAAVQNAAKSTFTSPLIQQNVNNVIDSNYAWLEGKTATPNFRVDLSSQKRTFAQKVGQYVKSYTAGLPVCTSAEQIQQQGNDLLAATCRPPGVTPEAAGARATNAINHSDSFLSNPVVTAQNVNPEASTQQNPYYKKLSELPKAYQRGKKLPVILGVLSVVMALCIIAAAPVRRRGVRRVGVVLLIAGLVLVLGKFIGDFAVKRLEDRVFDPANTGQLQMSLTNFAHRLESAMVRIDLWFGIAFLVLALIIFVYLGRTRQKSDPGSSLSSNSTTPAEPGEQSTLSSKRFKRRQPSNASNPYLDEIARAPDTPKRKKPPRLIQ